MNITVTFFGGPLDKRRATVARLDPRHTFFHPRNRQILVYVRENEVDYTFDPVASRTLTLHYDASVKAAEENHRNDPPTEVRFL